ncbi:MAG TPA: CAP domain-containing protein [Capillimicrobium sp.]|nr:CAP domain-containing protein [Capillimicrobium sp.]
MTHLGRGTAAVAAAISTLVALGFSTPASAQAACASAAAAVPQRGEIAAARAATLCLINRERRAHGLAPLKADRRLTRAATRYSRQMVRHGFFDHVGPGGSTMYQRVEAAGYTRWRTLGENIAWGAGPLASPARIVASWMRSPGHRRTILDARLREVGVGIARGAPQWNGDMPAATYTTDFGAR